MLIDLHVVVFFGGEGGEKGHLAENIHKICFLCVLRTVCFVELFAAGLRNWH
jgi:hypothetical protein